MLHYYGSYPPALEPNSSTYPVLEKEPLIHSDCTITDSKFGSYVEIKNHSSIRESSVGDFSFIGENASVVWTDIGKFCAIARAVRINPGNHPTWRVTQHHSTYRRQRYELGKVDDTDFFEWRKSHWCSIGHDVWIGTKSTIMAGVKIGVGAVIGAGSIVTKDVEPYHVVAGRPARFIKRRFSEKQAEQLMQIAWWDWSPEMLKERITDFNNIEAFIEKYS